MKRIIWGITLSALAAGSANAALLGRVPATPGGSDYQAYYDTGLNITWLADANYAKISGYSNNGGLIANWSHAQSWIGTLNAAHHLGVSDWRLPTTAQPDPTCSDQLNPEPGFPLQGYGFGCTGSEMGHLFNVEGISASTPGPFTNIMADGHYWSGTAAYAPWPNRNQKAWRFNFNWGEQGPIWRSYYLYAWPVRDGDIAPVPLPGALGLFSGALGMLGVMRRKSQCRIGA